MFYEQSEDYRPLFWFQGRPIYVTTALVIFHVAYFIALAVGIAVLGSDIFSFIPLTPDDIWHGGQVWRFFTYFAIPPSFYILFYMITLYFCGREIEQFIGRTAFIKLYASLLFFPAILFTLVGLFLPGLQYQGYFAIVFAVFIAFTTLYPGVCLYGQFVPITNLWLAWILISLFSILDFANHDIIGLSMLWLCSATAFASIRLFGAGRGLDWLVDWWEDRRLARIARQHHIKVVQKQEKEKSIDEILEKISRSGMGSLTAQEKGVLERARVELLKRDGR